MTPGSARRLLAAVTTATLVVTPALARPRRSPASPEAEPAAPAAPAAPAVAPTGVRSWLSPSERVVEASVQTWADGRVQEYSHVEEWRLVGQSGDTRTYRRITDPDTSDRSGSLYVLGPDGLSRTEELHPVDLGTWYVHDPAIVEVPASYGEWSACVAVPMGMARRTCRAVEGSPYCADGLVVTCRRTRCTREDVRRDHWCPSGLAGSEYTSYGDDGDAIDFEVRTRVSAAGAAPAEPSGVPPMPRREELEHPPELGACGC